jgi:protein-tyrosine-phosphatase
MKDAKTDDGFTVAFVCTHNACRSQIAEAWACRYFAGSVRAMSAGTHPDAMVDSGVVRIMRDMYGVDLSTSRPKTLDMVGRIDVLVTMGCGVTCPYVPGCRRVAWDIPDPTGGSDKQYCEIIELIREKVKDLATELAEEKQEVDRHCYRLSNEG